MRAKKKYNKGGKVKAVKKPPTDPPKTNPTASDSLFLLETNKIAESLLNLGYTPSGRADVDPNDWDAKYQFYLDRGINGLDFDLRVNSREKIKNKEDYLVEENDFTGLTDWLSGGDDDYFIPKSYIHPDIAPQYFSDFEPPSSLSPEEDSKVRDELGAPKRQPLPRIASFRYANLAITPTEYLTPEERKERIRLYGPENVGDINAPTKPLPESVLRNIANKSYSNPNTLPASNQVKPTVAPKKTVVSRPKLPVPDKMIPKGAPKNDYSNRSPILKKQATPILKKQATQESKGQATQNKQRTQPIMRMDHSKGNRFGQYQIGERFWDEKRKQWVDRMWDRDDRKASKELARGASGKKNKPKRKKTIVSFKDGGKITKSSSSEWYAKNGTEKKDEYNKKYHQSEERKKYRAFLNKKNRELGTYGNGDKKDVSHKKNGGIELEPQEKNRARNRGKK